MAMEAIEKCIITMLCTAEKIFYAHLLAQIRREPDKNIPTAGVYVSHGHMYMIYNPEWFAKFKTSLQIGILEHELLHLILEHILRGTNLHKEKFNIAADIAVNHFIPNLPDEVLRADKFGFEEGKSAEYYYNKIPSKMVKCSAQGGGKQSDQAVKPLDDHSVWEKSDNNQYTKETVKQAIKRAAEITERSRGDIPSAVKSLIDKLLAPPKVPWYRVLRQYLSNQIKAGTKLTWKRENRRYGDEVQGKSSDWTFKMVVGIDTSGSIGEKDLEKFMNEMAGIQRAHKATTTMIESDAAIGKVWPLTKMTNLRKGIEFTGGGGTDFRPVFKYVRDHKLNPHVLVYLTDMYGVFPEEKPPYQVIWVSCSDLITAPWGRVIKIEDTEEDKEEGN